MYDEIQMTINTLKTYKKKGSTKLLNEIEERGIK